ncbi:MAG TPA: hypothetical protein PKV17_11560, partial [Aquabacterium sp.]|nr:hypothetical protein [Aquabacterium sp.]
MWTVIDRFRLVSEADAMVLVRRRSRHARTPPEIDLFGHKRGSVAETGGFLMQIKGVDRGSAGLGSGLTAGRASC